MKNDLNRNVLQEALMRVEKARGEKANAGRRLNRARATVETATREALEADEELKAASALLDQAVRKGMSMALKKGGTDTSVALAEVIARSLSGEGASQATASTDGSDTPPSLLDSASAG